MLQRLLQHNTLWLRVPEFERHSRATDNVPLCGSVRAFLPWVKVAVRRLVALLKIKARG